jgi:rod shape-determining protein MreC
MRFIGKRRLYFIICLLISISILVGYKVNNSSYNNIIAKVADFIAPVEESAASMFYFVAHTKDELSAIFTTASESIALKKRNEYLESYYYLYKKVKSENKQLRFDLSFIENLEHNYVTAQVIARNNNMALQQIIVNIGRLQGVRHGQLAIARNQLLGRVVHLTDNTSTILLLSDNLSRIPAVSLDSKAKCIVAGNSSKFLTCTYLNEYSQLKDGELIVTSSDSIEITPGIIIGSIFIEKDRFYIKPIIDFEKIEFLQILMP